MKEGEQQQQQPTQVAATSLLPTLIKPRLRLTASQPPAMWAVASVAVVVSAAVWTEDARESSAATAAGEGEETAVSRCRARRL